MKNITMNMISKITIISALTCVLSNCVFSQNYDASSTNNRLEELNPLPIKFLFVDAVQKDEQIDMEWVTDVEFNSNYFLIQRSKDGVVFEDVKKVEAAGYSSVNKTYSFTDANPYKGVSYYRIKQYDLNGRYFYSHLVAAEFLEQNSVAIQTDNIKPENIISILGNKKYY